MTADLSQWTIRYFCATAPEAAARLDRLARRGDRDNLARAARDFSGAAHELGFWELAAFAATLGQRVSGATLHPIEPAIDAVRRITRFLRPHHSALWTGEIETPSLGKKPVGSRRALGRSPVLIVDPDETIRNAIHATLTDAGAREFMLAANFEEAAAMMNAMSPGLVIADWRPEPAGGCDIVCLIRAAGTAAPPDTPFVALAPESDRAYLRVALRTGADYFLLKPFTRDALLNAARIAIAKRAPARAA